MKRSDFFIRLTTGVLFLAVASYIGIYLYNAFVNPFETISAVSYTIEETLHAQGYIVRSETVIADSGATVLSIVSEGERVAFRQAVAVEYLNRAALETASELRALRLTVAEIESAGGRVSEAARLESVLELSRAVQDGDLSRLDEMSLNIDTLVFSATASQQSSLPALMERIEALERRSEGIRTISAPVSGIFSQVIDGFEHISPSALISISPMDLGELFRLPSSSVGIGKLVTEFKWYFAAVMNEEDAMRLTAGRRIVVQFSGVFQAEKIMLVENVGSSEDGYCVVLFSSDREIHNVVSPRQLSAEIVYDTISGIRVPREAIHLDENNVTTYIFLQTGARAERVNVEILRDYGDVYLVRDGLENDTPLRSGSTIIVRANNLYHGKVVG